MASVSFALDTPTSISGEIWFIRKDEDTIIIRLGSSQSHIEERPILLVGRRNTSDEDCVSIWNIVHKKGNELLLKSNFLSNEARKNKWSVSIQECLFEKRREIVVVTEKESTNNDEYDLFDDYSRCSTITMRYAPKLYLQVRGQLLNISSISNIDQSFQASIQCELCARHISTIDSKDAALCLLRAYGIEENRFSIGDSTDAEKWDGWRETNFVSLKSNKSNYDFTFKLAIYNATFGEKFELNNFPFDKQKLHIKLLVRQSKDWIELEENKEYPSLFVVTNFTLTNIWDVVYKSEAEVTIQSTRASESSSEISYPFAMFSITLRRQPWYYVINVTIPMAILTYLTFCSYSLSPDGGLIDLSDRLGITVTLILTAVAYKLAVAALIPTVSYLTLLDYYIYSCFVIMCIIAVFHTIFAYIAYFAKNSDSYNASRTCISLAILFTFFNIAVITSLVYWTNKRYINDTRTYNAKCFQRVKALMLARPETLTFLSTHPDRSTREALLINDREIHKMAAEYLEIKDILSDWHYYRRKHSFFSMHRWFSVEFRQRFFPRHKKIHSELQNKINAEIEKIRSDLGSLTLEHEELLKLSMELESELKSRLKYALENRK